MQSPGWYFTLSRGRKCHLLSRLGLTNLQAIFKSTRMSICSEFLVLYPRCLQELHKKQTSQVFTLGGLYRSKTPQRDWNSHRSCHCNAAAAGRIHIYSSWSDLLLQVGIIQTRLCNLEYMYFAQVLVVYITVALQVERRGHWGWVRNQSGTTPIFLSLLQLHLEPTPPHYPLPLRSQSL